MNKAHILTSPWPSDLEQDCPQCGHHFDARINIEFGRYGVPEVLKKIAWWAPLPSFPIALILCFKNPDRGLIMAVALGTIFPAVVLNLVSVMFPVRRRLRCWKCGYVEFSSVKQWKKL